MKFIKSKFFTRTGITLATIAIVIAGAAAFSAFEAHIVNVTATIENALGVSVTAIDFGTVFPQEHLDRPLTVALSDSFLGEDRVDDVEYFIRQKPKCGITSLNGTVLDEASTPTGHLSVIDGIAVPDCGEAPRVLLEGETFGVLPSLCPYISKEADGTPANDTSLTSFHVPWTVVDGQIVYTDAQGRLAKSDQDESDTWTIDLAVPTFQLMAAQDWLDFVRDITGNVDLTLAEANVFQLNPLDEHKVFGCDLWIEVSGVSESGEPPTGPEVGADLTTYTAPAPAECDVTVTTTIQAAINDADDDDTVCVPAGTYVEDVNVNKSITLAGAGASSTNLTGVGTGEAGALVISADNVTVQGFNVLGTGVSAIRISGSHTGITIDSNRATSAASQNSFLADGGQSNHTISNNEFVGASAGPIAYVNGLASVNVASTNVDFTQNTFSGAGTLALGQEADSSDVKLNKFSAVTSFADVEDWSTGIALNQNNFNDAGLNVQHSENGNTGDTGTTNAENNWWGDNDPSDGDASADVDFTPFEASAFPE